MSVTPLFHDRHAGGMALAQALSQHVRRPGSVVLGMARGGVAVAAPVARALDASLDTFVGRKLGVPGLEEVAFGAIAEGDEGPVLEGVHDYIGLPRRVVTTIVAREREEMARRIRRYRDGHPLPSLAGRTVIVVDDGLASGATLTAAGRALRRHRAARLIAAVPVASTDGLQAARATFDEVVAVATPAPFGTVSDWYHDYDPVSDAEVRALLGRAPAPEHPENAAAPAGNERDVAIPSSEPGFTLVMPGELGMPPDARSPHGLVILAHGGGSSRGSYRNRYLAARLRLAGWATLRVDLLGERERDADTDGEMRFDIARITRRLLVATRWCLDHDVAGADHIVLFGASTGAAAAIGVAAALPSHVHGVIARGGRVDLAADHLAHVQAPSLLVVGSADGDTLRLNRESARRLGGAVTLRIVRGAGHTFEEAGALGRVGEHVSAWLTRQRLMQRIRRWWPVAPIWPATLRAGMLARDRV